jgi:hypothetical protein
MAQSTPGDALQRKHLRVLLWASILSRTVTWILALAASHLPVFDSSPRILISERSLVDPLLRWDTFQFGPIALDGYVYEHNWAFFPGTPLVMRYSGLIVKFFRGTGKEATAVSWEIMLFGSALAVLLTFGATSTLYRLSVYHLRTPQLAFVASLLSLIPTSPATLYLAPYTEPFFTYLSYKGLLPSSTTPMALTLISGMLYCAQRMWLRATMCFVLAACFRSNGLLLGGFLLWGVVVQPSLKQRHVRGAVHMKLYAYSCRRRYNSELSCKGPSSHWPSRLPPSCINTWLTTFSAAKQLIPSQSGAIIASRPSIITFSPSIGTSDSSDTGRHRKFPTSSWRRPYWL